MSNQKEPPKNGGSFCIPKTPLGVDAETIKVCIRKENRSISGTNRNMADRTRFCKRRCADFVSMPAHEHPCEYVDWLLNSGNCYDTVEPDKSGVFGGNEDMATVAKIKISDNPKLRKQLDDLFDVSSQKEIAQWALKLAKHILESYAPAFENHKTVLEGFRVNEAWQQGNERMHDVRQAGFAVHRLAKPQENKIVCTALRVVGQAVASGHMKEHGMVASDYAIKCCNLAFPDDGKAVERERIWQIRELQKTCSNI